jgi:hypothetical protein
LLIALFKKPIEDQSFLARFVKGVAGHCCHRRATSDFFNRSV